MIQKFAEGVQISESCDSRKIFTALAMVTLLSAIC